MYKVVINPLTPVSAETGRVENHTQIPVPAETGRKWRMVSLSPSLGNFCFSYCSIVLEDK